MKRSMIFVVTNGAGLGHLTRGLAIAKRIRELDSEMEIIFLSTSLAVEIIRQEGFMFYYIPTRSLMPESVTPSLWNNYMGGHLKEMIQIYNPQAIVFDGAYPYGGLIGNLKEQEGRRNFWIKREGYKDNNKLESFEKLFHHVIVPMEAGKVYEADEKDTRWYCHPIIFLDEKESYARNELRKAWKVEDTTQIVYVQLGAGNINDIHSDIACTVQGILKNPNCRIVLGESIIGGAFNLKDDRVTIIREYPNSKYFKGVDFAVSAVGYNSYHELMYFGVPTLFIPNKQTAKDGQEARAMLAHTAGAAICLSDLTCDKVAEAMDYMIRYKQEMRNNAKKIMPSNGAREVAEYILQHM